MLRETIPEGIGWLKDYLCKTGHLMVLGSTVLEIVFLLTWYHGRINFLQLYQIDLIDYQFYFVKLQIWSVEFRKS